MEECPFLFFKGAEELVGIPAAGEVLSDDVVLGLEKKKRIIKKEGAQVDLYNDRPAGWEHTSSTIKIIEIYHIKRVGKNTFIMCLNEDRGMKRLVHSGHTII